VRFFPDWGAEGPGLSGAALRRIRPARCIPGFFARGRTVCQCQYGGDRGGLVVARIHVDHSTVLKRWSQDAILSKRLRVA